MCTNFSEKVTRGLDFGNLVRGASEHYIKVVTLDKNWQLEHFTRALLENELFPSNYLSIGHPKKQNLEMQRVEEQEN